MASASGLPIHTITIVLLSKFVQQRAPIAHDSLGYFHCGSAVACVGLAGGGLSKASD
ncbi:MAG: hypothetical protein ABIO49_05135 [Dokdonella sp.]